MTFQNLISRVPKWNSQIIETERKRICDKSGCNYLEDLVTCVHIIQLKILTAMRVGQKQKKIDINIPKLDDFIHKTYINVARKFYKNVYLFELNIPPLQVQKNHRELELIVQECILNTVRESIPVESILKAYMDETIEEDIVEEIKEQIIEPEPVAESVVPSSANTSNVTKETNIVPNTTSTSTPVQSGGSVETAENIIEKLNEEKSIVFNDIDYVKDNNNNEEFINAPKTIERLEEISQVRNTQRKLEAEREEEEEEENVKLKIFDENISLDDKDIYHFDSDKQELNLIPDLLLDDIEVLG